MGCLTAVGVADNINLDSHGFIRVFHSVTLQRNYKLGEHSRATIRKKREDLEFPLVGAVGGGLAVELVDGDLDLPQEQTHSAGVGGDVQDLTVLHTDVNHQKVNTHHRHTPPDR